MAEKMCQSIFSFYYSSNVESLSADNSRAVPTSFSKEKISSFKVLSGHFYGQSCLKTVRGSLLTLKAPKLRLQQTTNFATSFLIFEKDKV